MFHCLGYSSHTVLVPRMAMLLLALTIPDLLMVTASIFLDYSVFIFDALKERAQYLPLMEAVPLCQLELSESMS